MPLGKKKGRHCRPSSVSVCELFLILFAGHVHLVSVPARPGSAVVVGDGEAAAAVAVPDDAGSGGRAGVEELDGAGVIAFVVCEGVTFVIEPAAVHGQHEGMVVRAL